MLSENRDNFSEIFVKVEKIGDKEFIFSGIDGGGEVLALVKEPHSDIYKVVAFKISRSDNQWKSFPGIRKNGQYVKGDESNPAHHYVQSAKLHPDVHRLLDSLHPLKSTDFRAKNYIPDYHRERYTNEFTFREEYLYLKDKSWESSRKTSFFWYYFYLDFVCDAYQPRDYTLSGNFSEKVGHYMDQFRRAGMLKEEEIFIQIKTELENMNKDPRLSECLILQNLPNLDQTKNTLVRNFIKVYDGGISTIVGNISNNIRIPESMKPDFAASNCVRKYVKNPKRDNTIYIEEYVVRSPEGDELIYSMASDSKGNIYIDNIYDPRVGVTEYGTLSEIVQMGLLVYKPEDYTNQAQFGFPRHFLAKSNSGNDDYVNINALWREIPVIRAYAKEINNRSLRSRELNISTAGVTTEKNLGNRNLGI